MTNAELNIVVAEAVSKAMAAYHRRGAGRVPPMRWSTRPTRSQWTNRPGAGR